MPRAVLLLASVLLVVACGSTATLDRGDRTAGDAGTTDDGGRDGSTGTDGGPWDASGLEDGGPWDAGGLEDGGPWDASGLEDGGPADAGDGGGGTDGGALAPLGTPCTDDTECRSGMCSAIGWDPGGLPICTADCMAGGADCPEGGVCVIPGAARGWCSSACTSAFDCAPGVQCIDVGWPDERACVPAPYDCDPKTVVCDGPEPMCGSRIARVEQGCWTGECVDFDECRAIPCDPDLPLESQCPPALVCFRSTRTCHPPL